MIVSDVLLAAYYVDRNENKRFFRVTLNLMSSHQHKPQADKDEYLIVLSANSAIILPLSPQGLDALLYWGN